MKEKDWNTLHEKILKKIIADTLLAPGEIESIQSEFIAGTEYLKTKLAALQKGQKRLKSDKDRFDRKKAKLNSRPL